jgi:hypothetical protein
MLRFFRPQRDHSTRRFQARRQLRVEALEGRQLLSTFTAAPAIVGSHLGYSSAAIQGGHIGTNVMSADVQGGHPGTGISFE